MENGGFFAARKYELEIFNVVSAAGTDEALAGHDTIEFEFLILLRLVRNFFDALDDYFEDLGWHIG